MKRLLFITLAIVLISGLLLAACGQGATTTVPPKTTQAAPPPASSQSPTPPPPTQAKPPSAPPPATSAPAAAGPQVYGGTLAETFIMGGAATFGFPPAQLSERYYNYCFEPLIRETYEGKLEPLLATKWELAPNLQSLTLTLRKGVKFHDGSDFNAAVAKWNLEKQKEYKKAITKFFESIDIVDDYTIRINLNKYQNNLLSNLANVVGLMTSKEAFDKNGLDWCQAHPVGTSPFKFVSYERDVGMKWEKFSGYWQAGRPFLDAITMTWIADPMTQQAAMLQGTVQIMYGGGGSSIYRDLQAKGFNLIFRPADALSLWPDSANADSPFAKAEVRQAVSYGIDREALIKIAEGGFPTAAYQLPPKFARSYDPSYAGTQYDPEKAKKLLADAGFPNGFKTTIASPFTPRDVMVAIQGYLAKINITADINQITMGQYTELSTKGWRNTMLVTPITHYVNWASGLQSGLSSTAINLVSVKRPNGFDSLLEQALATPEEDVNKTRQALRLLQEPCYVIPLYSAGTMWCYSPKVHDIGYTELGNALFRTPDKAWLSK